MAIVDDEESLRHYMAYAVNVDTEMTTSGQEVAILVDQFLEDAYEVDVDALADGEQVVIGGMHCSISKRPASTAATAPACCRPTRSAATI